MSLIVYPGVVLAAIISLYPIIYVVSASVSNPVAVIKGQVWLYPVGLDLGTFKAVLSNKSLWTAYYNTLWYTVVGTCLNVAFTIIAAYPLSRKQFFARNFFMLFIVFTMYFSGGIVPTFILVYNLGLFNTRWAIVIPVLINAWNLIICRTYFQSMIPEELLESARLDGASEFRMVRSVVFPLSKPIVAVMFIFYGVAHWNSFFTALIYIRDEALNPLQIYLRRMLIQYSPGNLAKAMGFSTAASYEMAADAFTRYMQVKYVVIIVSLLPILCIYPFFQRYFVKGVMIGSLKG